MTTSKKKPLLALGGLVALAFGAWLAFGFFGIHTAFIDDKVDEAGPVFTESAEGESAPATTAATAALSSSEANSETPERVPASAGTIAEDDALLAAQDPAADATEATDPEAVEDPESAEPIDTTASEPEAAEPAVADPPETTVATAPEGAEPAEAAAGEVVTTRQGDFSGSADYDVSGTASVLSNGTSQRFVRFENFDSDNGPDLKVYLRAENGDFVNLGDLKGNIGDQNYEIPADVDLGEFGTVEIWCERFGAGFGSAQLAEA